MTISRPMQTVRQGGKKKWSFCLCYFSRSEEDLAPMDSTLQNVMDIIQAASLIRMLPGNNQQKKREQLFADP